MLGNSGGPVFGPNNFEILLDFKGETFRLSVVAKTIDVFFEATPTAPHFNVSANHTKFHFQQVTKYSRERNCHGPNAMGFLFNIEMWGRGGAWFLEEHNI